MPLRVILLELCCTNLMDQAGLATPGRKGIMTSGQSSAAVGVGALALEGSSATQP
jgi:hypothetical protein